MNVFHNPLSRAGQDFLPSPRTANSREPKQRRMMAIALALLVFALAVVLYKDRDFWFPDTQADDQLEPVPATIAAQLETKPVTQQPAAPITKSATTDKDKKNHNAKSKAKEAALVPTAAAASTDQAISAPPMTATTTRTVLPPLEVEVVAGDNHRKLRPGSNGVHVDLQPGARTEPDTLALNNTPAAPAEVTTNASEHVQMSTDTTEAVSKTVKPDYPTLARQMKVQGSVILQALIGRDGSIQSLKVVSGPGILAAAAEEAVRQWRFKPHYVNSEAVETQANITVNFTISTS